MAQGRGGAGGSSVRGSGASLALALFCAAAPLRPSAAQAPTYDASQFACTTFDVRVSTNVTTDLQGRRRVEELRRDGRLSVKGTVADSGVALEAWWDTLALWRRADGRTLTPDVDGILGGRYRGLLTPDGRFTRTAAPWVPDEVAEVSDLSVALDDLFPNFSIGTVRRLTNGAGHQRYRLLTTSEVDGPASAERPFAVHESESSDGIVVWGRAGLISWTRQVTAETRVAEAPRRTFRSTVVQGIELRRVGVCAGG